MTDFQQTVNLKDKIKKEAAEQKETQPIKRERTKASQIDRVFNTTLSNVSDSPANSGQ